MPFTSRTRLVNPWLGTYFGIFTSLFVGLVLVVLIFEQLGIATVGLNYAMLIGPIACYLGIGLAGRTAAAPEYFASGRRVPAVFAGVGIAISTGGASLLMVLTGLFFINGFDAWAIALGAISGLLAMSVLVAPFYRKFGAYTVSSFLARRFESRLLRVLATALLVVPMLLIIVAELRLGVFALTWLTGLSAHVVAALMAAAIIATLGLGGMRSLSWSSTAQAIVALLAIIVPVTMVAVLLTNLPLPQFSYGPVLRGIGRFEASQGIPTPILSPMAFGYAGSGIEPLARRFAAPFGSVGAASFVFTTLTIMIGIAASPWLLPRTTTTPSVYETRKSLGWAIVLLGLVALTASAAAVFMRDAVMDTLVGQLRTQLPAWFTGLVSSGLASIDARLPRPPMEAIGFHRDSALFLLPIAYGYPVAFLQLALAGAGAAALAAAGNACNALAATLAEDVIGGLGRLPPSDSVRLTIARACLVAVTCAAALITTSIATDPLKLLLWSLAISASVAFPVVMLSIWWKRINAWGAIASMSTGFGVSIAAILASESAFFGVPSAFSAIFAVPLAFVAAIIVTWLTPPPPRHVLEAVRDLRMPGGETLHDREVRLQRLKQRQQA